MILITGAAGKTGRAILRALNARGDDKRIRVFVRRAEQVQALLALGAQEFVVGEFYDCAALAEAVHDIRVLYHICPNVHPDEVTIGDAVISAAQKANVARFVYHSVLHPQTQAMPHHWNKLRVEEMLLESRLPFTILQPAPYMQNMLANWHAIQNEGVYRVPYALGAPFSWVDLDDVAAVAARVLTEGEHAGAVYELAGPEVLTPLQVAEKFARVLGREVRAERVEILKWKADAEKNGMSAYAVETLTKMFAYYDAFGLWGNPRVLTHLLSRAPTTLDEFIHRAQSSPEN